MSVDIASNYDRLGRYVAPPPSSSSLLELKAKYPEAFSQESENALAAVLDDLQLPFSLTAFQTFATNAMLNKVDVFGILPTGSGKTLPIYLFSLAMRKLPRGFKSFPPSATEQGLVLVSMPLSMLIQAQLSNPFGCKVACLSMTAEVTGSGCKAVGTPNLKCAGEPITDTELVDSDDYLLLFFHPEVADDERGRKLFRALSMRGKIAGLVIDEVHLGLRGHWETFRPGMLRKVMNLKAYLVQGAPLTVLSATLTEQEVADVITLAGRKKAMAVVAQGPLPNNTKICVIKRPSSQVDFFGEEDSKGREVPGLLHLLRELVLDKFLEAVSQGPPYQPFHKSILFFRNSQQMCEVHGWLMNQLGGSRLDTSPFCMNHSQVSKSGQAILQARINEYLLILTTSRMLLGLDVEGVRQVILVARVNRGTKVDDVQFFT